MYRSCFIAVNGKKIEIPETNDEFINLIEKMLIINPNKRITIEELIKNPYFKSLCKIPDSPKSDNEYGAIPLITSPKRFKINYQSSESVESGVASAGNALNAAFTASAQLFIGGSGSAFDGNNLSGSVMEYRLWSEPLSQSKFDNHVRTPKSYNGNTTSSHYNNLIYRNTFDENQDLSLTSSVSNSADVLSYNSTGSAVGYSANLY